jgi:hypothetical protein
MAVGDDSTFILDLPRGITSVSPVGVPYGFKLEQNYPNPFNPATTIQFTIPERKMVSLRVYNLLGQEVATLVEEEKPAGSYEVVFDASELPSGSYFYKIIAGNFVETKKMILIK